MYSTKFQTQIADILNNPSVQRFQELADPVIRDSMRDLAKHLGANAAALWVRPPGEEKLTIAVNVGIRGTEVEGKISQDLSSGLVSKAFKENVVICDEGPFRHSEQSMDVDMELGQMTQFQIAGPIQMFGTTVGAVTDIQMTTADSPAPQEWGFQKGAEEIFRRWLPVAQRLFEWQHIQTTA
ncbi:MAG: hypothetical protein AAF939_21465 [Planctomycetota bacterium]